MSQKFFPQLKCLHNILISILSKAPGALDKIFAGWPIPINDTLKHRESNGTLAVTQQFQLENGSISNCQTVELYWIWSNKKRQL